MGGTRKRSPWKKHAKVALDVDLSVSHWHTATCQVLNFLPKLLSHAKDNIESHQINTLSQNTNNRILNI